MLILDFVNWIMCTFELCILRLKVILNTQRQVWVTTHVNRASDAFCFYFCLTKTRCAFGSIININNSAFYALIPYVTLNGSFVLVGIKWIYIFFGQTVPHVPQANWSKFLEKLKLFDDEQKVTLGVFNWIFRIKIVCNSIFCMRNGLFSRPTLRFRLWNAKNLTFLYHNCWIEFFYYITFQLLCN